MNKNIYYSVSELIYGIRGRRNETLYVTTHTMHCINTKMNYEDYAHLIHDLKTRNIKLETRDKDDYRPRTTH